MRTTQMPNFTTILSEFHGEHRRLFSKACSLSRSWLAIAWRRKYLLAILVLFRNNQCQPNFHRTSHPCSQRFRRFCWSINFQGKTRLVGLASRFLHRSFGTGICQRTKSLRMMYPGLLPGVKFSTTKWTNTSTASWYWSPVWKKCKLLLWDHVPTVRTFHEGDSIGAGCDVGAGASEVTKKRVETTHYS